MEISFLAICAAGPSLRAPKNPLEPHLPYNLNHFLGYLHLMLLTVCRQTEAKQGQQVSYTNKPFVHIFSYIFLIFKIILRHFSTYFHTLSLIYVHMWGLGRPKSVRGQQPNAQGRSHETWPRVMPKLPCRPLEDHFLKSLGKQCFFFWLP